MTKKQSTCFKINIILFVVVVSLSLLLFYLNTSTNNNFSLQQISKTSNLNSNSISRQYRLNTMAKFMQIIFESPKLKQTEIADQLSYSSSILHRQRNDIDMLSPYRIQTNNTNERTEKASNTIFDNNSHHDPDVKRPRLTSNDLKRTSDESVEI